MLDIKFIRENPDLIKQAARKKKIDFNVDTLLQVEEKRSALLAEVELMRAEQNTFTDKIARATDQDERQGMIDQMKTFKDGLTAKENKLKEVIEEWRLLMVQVPNVPDVTVPEGESDADNKEVKRWGEPTKFSFPAKSHIDIMVNHNMADFERGTKVAGFRGYFLKGDGVLLTNAIWQLALKHWIGKGFMPMIVP